MCARLQQRQRGQERCWLTLFAAVMDSSAPAPVISNGRVGDWRLSDTEFLASFRLPGAADKHDKLKEQNPLPRDARIVFDEAKHEYWIDGFVKVPRSVTGLVHAYASHFDPHAAVHAMKGSAKWLEKREAFLTDSGRELEDDEIVDLWAHRGRVASARGTLLHWHAEMHLNGREMELPHSPEFVMLINIVDALKAWGLRPYRTEISLFHCGLCLAGQADALFVDERSGDIAILDWKRTQRIRFDNPFRSLKEPLNHLPEANGWLYCLQLNIYKYMLETENGLRVSSMFLGQVHPSLPRGRLIRVPCMAEEEVTLIVEDQLARKEAVSAALPGEDAPFVLPGQTASHMCDPRPCACSRAHVLACVSMSTRLCLHA